MYKLQINHQHQGLLFLEFPLLQLLLLQFRKHKQHQGPLLLLASHLLRLVSHQGMNQWELLDLCTQGCPEKRVSSRGQERARRRWTQHKRVTIDFIFIHFLKGKNIESMICTGNVFETLVICFCDFIRYWIVLLCVAMFWTLTQSNYMLD